MDTKSGTHLITHQSNWPHAPAHRTLASGTYMVTAATYQKQLYFRRKDSLDFLNEQLLCLAQEYGWELQAWAIFANHYHFIAQSPKNPENLSHFIAHLHVKTAQFVNDLDKTLGRMVWWQYWDTHITRAYSYFPRLKYVMHNPVKHGLVTDPSDYPWCSAHWFESTSPKSFRQVIDTFKIDRLSIPDDF